MDHSNIRLLSALTLAATLTACVTTSDRAYETDRNTRTHLETSASRQASDVNQTRSQPTQQAERPGESAASCNPDCRVKVEDAHPHEALAEHADRFGIDVNVEGKLLDPISVEVNEPTVDRLVRKLAAHGGYLVAQQGHQYTFYGTEVEEVTIAIALRHIEASDAATQLNRFEQIDVVVLQSANALVVRGSSEGARRAANFLEIIDYERPNVFLELMVVEYFHGDSFEWSFDIVNAQKGKVSDATFSPGGGLVTGQYDVIADLDKAFRVNLRALVDVNEARVVTNPHVAVRSGQPGQINFTEELNIILTNATENFGVTRNLQRLESGVRLNVTPQVLSTGFVDLNVDGEVSVFVPAPEGQFGIDRQTVKTEVLVEDGDTLVIGGLVTKQVTSTESGVPLLRRIPLVGKLFSAESSSEHYVETVIYITPHINKPDAFLPGKIEQDVERHFEDS